MNKLLARQLKRALGVKTPGDLDAVQAELDKLVEEEVDPRLRLVVSRLPKLLEMVDRAYEQFYRDLTLRSRSLELSSSELRAANDQLRSDSIRTQTLLDTLVAATDRLMAEAGFDRRNDTPPTPEELCETLVESSEALANARRRAEAASTAKSTFMATMSHEIRTPMNGVLGMVQLLAQTSLDAKQEGYVQRLQGSAEHLLRIIDDILEFSRCEADKVELELAPFYPRSVAEKVQEMLEARASEKNIGLLLETHGPDAELSGDSHRVRQILLNLVGNAIKFTEKGEVHLCSTTSLLDGTRARVRYEVRDTGVGMSHEACQRIFNAFVQADGSMAREYGGSGLGLAISQRLAGLMGSEIRVESRLGVGSTFSFELDLDLAGTVASPPRGCPDVQTSTLRDGLRVLVVEDNAINQMVVTEMLELLGVEYEVACDGVEAVEMCDGRSQLDLVLMDCQMPRKNGYEATQEIRTRLASTVPFLPIIGLTANALPEDRTRSLEAGMNDFLAKPFTLSALREVLAAWTQSGGAPTGRSKP